MEIEREAIRRDSLSGQLSVYIHVGLVLNGDIVVVKPAGIL